MSGVTGCVKLSDTPSSHPLSLRYLFNHNHVKYTYDYTHWTHSYHPIHTLFQYRLYRSRDHRPHHIGRTVSAWGGAIDGGGGSGGAVLSRSCSAVDAEVSQHKFH